MSQHHLVVRNNRGVVDVRCAPCNVDQRFEGKESWKAASVLSRQHRNSDGVNDVFVCPEHDRHCRTWRRCLELYT